MQTIDKLKIVKTKNKKLVHKYVLIIIAKKLKQLQCPLTDEWISKMLYTNTVDYNSGMKRKGVSIHVTSLKICC